MKRALTTLLTGVTAVGYPADRDRLMDPSRAPSWKDGTVSSVQTRDGVPFVEVSADMAPGILKPRLYAEAGIRWYLRVEQEGPVGHLHELVEGAYREVARGPVVEIAEPFAATLDLPHLAR